MRERKKLKAQQAEEDNSLEKKRRKQKSLEKKLAAARKERERYTETISAIAASKTSSSLSSLSDEIEQIVAKNTSDGKQDDSLLKSLEHENLEVVLEPMEVEECTPTKNKEEGGNSDTGGNMILAFKFHHIS